jgi:hypothetical protein
MSKNNPIHLPGQAETDGAVVDGMARDAQGADGSSKTPNGNNGGSGAAGSGGARAPDIDSGKENGGAGNGGSGGKGGKSDGGHATEADGGQTIDAAQALDAGKPSDASQAADAAPKTDAEVPPEAGQKTDGSTPASDAGHASDAGQKADGSIIYDDSGLEIHDAGKDGGTADAAKDGGAEVPDGAVLTGCLAEGQTTVQTTYKGVISRYKELYAGPYAIVFKAYVANDAGSDGSAVRAEILCKDTRAPLTSRVCPTDVWVNVPIPYDGTTLSLDATSTGPAGAMLLAKVGVPKQ